MVIAHAELTLRRDHAVGDVPVGLASCDSEVAGKNGAWKRDDDRVADAEVVGSADDAAHIRATIGGELALRRDSHLAPVDGLSVRLRLRLSREHLADDDRALQLSTVDGLVFQSDADKRVEHRSWGGRGWDLRVLAEPGEWGTHD